MNKRTDILDAKQQILTWIAGNQSKAFICRQLKCKSSTLDCYLRQFGITYAGNMGGRGIKTAANYKSAAEYIQGTCIHSHVLKEKLVRDGLRKDCCEICGVSIWNGVKLPLELHHVDRNHFNNSLDNLQILCPNCHSIQEGNSGANIGKYAELAELADAPGLDPGLVKSNCEFKSHAQHHKKIIDNDRLDSLGRYYSTILTEEEWKYRLELILASGVDLTVFGWKAKVQTLTGLTRRQVDDTILHFKSELKDKIYIRHVN